MLDLLLGIPKRRGSEDGGWVTTNSGGQGTYTPGRRKTQAGVIVDQNLAMTYSACWCATRILLEAACPLPLCLMRRQDNGGSVHATDDYRYDLVKNSPNWEMGSIAFREGRMNHQINWGNGFAEIQRKRQDDVRSEVLGLWPIHPSRVQPILPQDLDEHGRPIVEYKYRVTNNDGRQIGLGAHEVLHFAGALTEDGIWGKSVVAYGRESIGMGLGTERHGATRFGSGNVPNTVLWLPNMKDSEARRNFRREWKEIHGSPDAGEVAILPVDGKMEIMSFSNEASQYLETRSFEIRDVARWYRVPTHLLKEMMAAAGYNSLEHLSLEFVVYELMPWMAKIEEQLNLKLLSPEERLTLYFEHQLHGLLRGDQKSRYEAYRVGLEAGFLTLNIVKRLEGMPTIGPEGDEHYIMSNMTTARRIFLGLGPPTQALEGAAPATAGKALPDKGAAAKAAPEGPSQPEELLDLADVRQTGSFDCGAAATQTVAVYFGKDEGRQESDYIRELGTTETDGTEPENVIDWLNDHGLVTMSGQGMTLDDLRQFFANGKPVIVPLQMYGDTPEYDEEESANQTGHYVVVRGIAVGLVFFQDPIGGRQMMSEADFDQRWHDLEADGVVDDHFGIAVSASFADEEGTEETTTAAKTSGQAAASTSDSLSAAQTRPASIAAARGVLVSALERILTREAHDAARAAKKDLSAWLEVRIAPQRQYLEQTLAPAFAVLQSAGLTLDSKKTCEKILTESTTILLRASVTDSLREFEQRMKVWKDRADSLADLLLSPTKAGA